MIDVDEALARYAGEIEPLPAESVAVADALGRVLAEDAASRIDLPPFSQSAMDGYAVRASDTAGATEASPVRLRVVGEVPAGATGSAVRLGACESARIFTGAPLPGGADAVVRQERARREGDAVVVAAPAGEGEDLRARGEELREGERLAERGTRLGSGALASLANGGVAELSVVRRPRVACIVTGDELVEPGRPLREGQVYDANLVLVSAWLRAAGLGDGVLLRATDDLAETESRIDEAARRADLVVTTGGVSVGDRDHVIPAARAAGFRDVFWKVRQKPGKPLYFAMRGAVPLLGLPGNPGSVFCGLAVHARRVVGLLEGAAAPEPRLLRAALATDVRPGGDRVVWLRCSERAGPDGRTSLLPLERQGSHMLSNLARCDALARIPEGRSALPAGSVVTYVRV